MKKSELLITALIVLSLMGVTEAEPFMALRGGYKCNQCHVNRTGGGMRTSFGVSYSQALLPRRFISKTEHSPYFDGKAGSHIAFGANMRLSSKTKFKVDAQPGESQFTRGYDFPEGNIYFRFDLIEDMLTFYVDETILPSGARNRESFLLIQNLPLDGYLKAGRMLLPYGVRILDDESFIRQFTGYNYDNQDIGYEFGIEPGPLSLSLAITNGTQGSSENNVEKQISFVGSTVFRHFRVGGSYSRNKIPGTITDQTTTMMGAFAGLSAGRITWIGEVDLIHLQKDVEGEADIYARENWGDRLLLYSSVNLLLARGLNLRLAYDYYDPRIKWDEDERTRVTLGVEYFPIQFLQISASYKLLESVPQKPRENEDQLIVEVHVFF